MKGPQTADLPVRAPEPVDARSRLRTAGVSLAGLAGVSAVLAWALYTQVRSPSGASGGFLLVGALAAGLSLPAFVEPAAIVVSGRPGRRPRLQVAGWAVVASLGWTALWMGLVDGGASLLPGDDTPILLAVTVALIAVVAGCLVLLPLLARRRAAVQAARVVCVLLAVWALWRFSRA
ncbi:MAG TPA: hypothetical protein VGD72_12900 [Mycobacteriales bacterium]